MAGALLHPRPPSSPATHFLHALPSRAQALTSSALRRRAPTTSCAASSARCAGRAAKAYDVARSRSERAESFRILRLVVRRWQMIQVSRPQYMVYYAFLAGLARSAQAAQVVGRRGVQYQRSTRRRRRRGHARTVSRVTRGAEVRAHDVAAVRRGAAQRRRGGRRAPPPPRGGDGARQVVRRRRARRAGEGPRAPSPRSGSAASAPRTPLVARLVRRARASSRGRTASGRLSPPSARRRAATATKSDARRLMRSVASAFRTNRARAAPARTRGRRTTHNLIYAAGARIVPTRRPWPRRGATGRAPRAGGRASVIEHLKHISARGPSCGGAATRPKTRARAACCARAWPLRPRPRLPSWVGWSRSAQQGWRRCDWRW